MKNAYVHEGREWIAHDVKDEGKYLRFILKNPDPNDEHAYRIISEKKPPKEKSVNRIKSYANKR